MKWSQEREQSRKKERETQAALYFNPFLSACEDLQSRIYTILEMDGIRSLRIRYPDGKYARGDRVSHCPVFRMAGHGVALWAVFAGPGDDPADRGGSKRFLLPGLSHRAVHTFFRPEQKALGKLAMIRFEGQHGIEMDTISFYRFEENLEVPPLSESHSVQQSLDALKNAKSVRSLHGKERLAEAHCHLVDLLTYAEIKAGFSLFPGKRRKCAANKENGGGAHSGNSA